MDLSRLDHKDICKHHICNAQTLYLRRRNLMDFKSCSQRGPHPHPFQKLGQVFVPKNYLRDKKGRSSKIASVLFRMVLRGHHESFHFFGS